MHRTLDLDRALHRVLGVGKLNQEAVAHGLDFPATVRREQGIDQSLLLLEEVQRPGFVRVRKRGVSVEVGKHDGGKSTQCGHNP